MSKKFFRQRGQASVLYALLIPLLILAVGVGMDLGWYYLNVSRLQNAADAAALAGAQELVDDNTKTMYRQGYYVDGLISPPSDLDEKEKYTSFNLSTEDGVVTVNLKDNLLNEDELQAGEDEAKLYAKQNLYEVLAEGVAHKTGEKDNLADEWTHKRNVKFGAMLYTRTIDWKNETTVYQNEASTAARYYKVTLSEKINHLFLGNLAPMEAKVVACAIIMPHDKDLITTIEALRKEKTIANWEYQNYYKNFLGTWDHYQSPKVYYTAGDDYRTEKTNVSPTTAVGTTANNPGGNKNTFYREAVDSINLDFRIDSVFKGTYNGWGEGKASNWDFDWDLRSELPEGITRDYQSSLASGWTATDNAANLRIITSFNFTGKWTDRNPDDLRPDILWTSIESDPMWFSMPFKGNAGMKGLNSVRQIVLNVKESNAELTTVKDSAGVDHTVYLYRPFFIVYLGPEVNNAESLNTVRQSQPVILNLYQNWNAILYMPNSPVIINGNNHKLTGFVIAKEYRRLKTIDEFSDTDYIKGKDDYSHTLIVPKNLATYVGKYYSIFDNTTKKTITEVNLKKMLKDDTVTKRLIIESQYVKGLEGYTDDDYVAGLKQYRNITDDSEIVRVTFPTSYQYKEGNGNTVTIYNNTQSYAVVKSDLLDEDPDPNITDSIRTNEKNDQYVPVITSEGTKYIDKINLPYVKVFRSNNYCYVPVCDVKLISSSDKYHAGVRLANDDTNKTLESSDTWRVHRDAMNSIYQPKYEKSEVYKIVSATNAKFFVFKSEVNTPVYATEENLSGRRKFTTADDEVYYVDESTESDTYYMQLIPDGSTEENPIIVDNLGDLQSVRITPEEVLNVTESDTSTKNANNALMSSTDEIVYKYLNTYTRAPYDGEGGVERPADMGKIIDGEYRVSSAKRQKKDYRIPVLERVYKKSTFNLLGTSGYSSFQIPELERVNYEYLNVNELNIPEGKVQSADMFFTEKRAAWID